MKKQEKIPADCIWLEFCVGHIEHDNNGGKEHWPITQKRVEIINNQDLNLLDEQALLHVQLDKLIRETHKEMEKRGLIKEEKK